MAGVGGFGFCRIFPTLSLKPYWNWRVGRLGEEVVRRLISTLKGILLASMIPISLQNNYLYLNRDPTWGYDTDKYTK